MKLGLQFWKFLSACILLSFLIGCASTGSPSGGPRDTEAPDLVEEKSAKNFSTNYSPEKIELVFDEWIELKNQQREILISPPFFKNPKITSRGKKVTVEFPEEEPLREDATYTINFGKSIVDFTEGNATEGFRFVFATGDKIDSLEFSGSIADAIDDKPVKDILVLLYDLVEDSVVVNEKPFYYARTDDSGSFKFENLKNDTFKLLVLEDLNFNYLLDPEIERLAFPDSLFILNDSSSYNPKLRLFKPEQSLRILSSNSKNPGKVTTVFNKKAQSVDFQFLYPEDFDPIVETIKDTLLFWFSEPRDSIGVIYGIDTLDFNIKPFDSLFYSKKLDLVESNAAKTILAPFDSLSLLFSTPLAQIDTSLIRLIDQPKKIEPSVPMDSTQMKIQSMFDDLGVDYTSVQSDSLQLDSLLLDSMQLDSVQTDVLPPDSLGIKSDIILDSAKDSLLIIEDSTSQVMDSTLLVDSLNVIDILGNDSLSVNIDSLSLDSLLTDVDTALVVHEYTNSIDVRKLFIKSKWQEKYSYRIELLPGAITDIYGRTNDSIMLDFKTASLDEFGNISINLSGLDSAQRYVVLLKLNDEIVEKTIVLDTTINKIEHKQLRVNTYTIELIKDDDGNGEWTTGDYWLKRQPEELKTFTLEKLRENWDLEAEVFWNKKESVGVDSTGIGQDSTTLDLPIDRGVKGDPAPKPDKRRGPPKGAPDPKGKNDD